MNTQTQEALHKALKVLNCLNNDRVYETAWVKGAINACEEALEQPAQEIGDAEIKQMLDDIEYYQKRVEELEQPAQEPVAWTDEYKNFLEWDKESLCDKAVCKDHEAIPLYTHPAPQPAQEPVLNVEKIISEFPLLDDEGLDEDKHHCEWAIQQDRKRLHAIIKNTHPAPSCQECENLKHDLEGYMDANKALINREWQGLSDDEIEDLCHKYWDSAKGYSIGDIIDMAEQALRNKNGY